jgi:uncharacterized protein YoxC
MQPKPTFQFINLSFVIFQITIFLLVSTTLFAQSDKATQRTNEIAKKLEIYDPQVTGRMRQATELYYKDLEEAEKIQDPVKKKVKILRVNQQYDAQMKSVMTPEQAKFYMQMRNAENKPAVAKKTTKKPTPKPVKKSKKSTKKQS